MILKNRNYLVIGFAAIFSVFLKLAYALSRPLFYSGPDANGFIPGAEGFATLDFWSGKIPYQPYQPPGYPFLLSILVRLSPLNWIYYAQIVQVLLFTISSIFFYFALLRLFGSKVALFVLLVLLFHSAWIVANGEAMYESFFVSALMFYIYFMTRLATIPDKKSFVGFFGGLCAGLACAIHPRAIPLIVLSAVFLFLFQNVRGRIFFLHLLSISVFPLVFALRNLIAEKHLTLSDATWSSFLYNAFFAGCKSAGCLVSKAAESPFGFFRQSFFNLLHFYSPYTGTLKRGTWYHNISPIRIFELNDHQYIANFYAILVISIAFILWIIGTIALLGVNRNWAILFLCMTGLIMATDMVVYGENRHRLIAMIFMLPSQTKALLMFIDHIKLRIVRRTN
jgi:hypothetical protein